MNTANLKINGSRLMVDRYTLTSSSIIGSDTLLYLHSSMLITISIVCIVIYYL